MSDFVVKVGGEGGTDSPTTAGEFMAQAAIREGNAIFTMRSFPAEIRGGLATYSTRLCDHDVLSQGDRPDVLFCMNQEAYDKLVGELAPGGVLVFDTDSVTLDAGAHADLTLYGVPMQSLAQGHVGEKRTKNMVLLGVFSALFGMPLDTLKQCVRDKYGKRGEELVAVNHRALEVGSEFVAESLTKTDPFAFEPHPEAARRQMIIDGSQAIGMGALAAKVEFFAGYPITPATDVMQFLAEHLPQLGGQVIQVEDEIASLGACLGASYTGAKSMTATSGPGLSLMVELLGLATMVELPVVIVDVQRGGPSTGLPTKTENGDLNLAALGAHGDAPRVVVAPANVQDCFYDTVGAFNLSEAYQTPVILLSDQSMAMRAQAMAVPDMDAVELRERRIVDGEPGPGYRRYELTSDGVSAVALPGTGTRAYHMITGLNHDELGYPSTNDGPLSMAMMNKRQRKLDAVRGEPGWSRLHGPDEARIGVISWGTCEGAVAEAVDRLNAEHPEAARALHLRLVWPLPVEEIMAFAATVKRVVVVELNFSGQLNQLIRAETLLPTELVRKFDGTVFTPGEIADQLRDLMPEPVVPPAVPSSTLRRRPTLASTLAK
ncbi:MAG: 2-oxoacid:acceptor oxidoreductase subunit alpha [Armatimonadetes bacterium]|nr:2-oxoacid:acceptor oxidoreductase subunit alpha [Armatimonadota bacterium]